MRAGYAGGQVNRHADANAPDDTDFPQSKAGASDLERCNTTGTKKNQQRGAQKFSQALTRQRGLLQGLRYSRCHGNLFFCCSKTLKESHQRLFFSTSEKSSSPSSQRSLVTTKSKIFVIEKI